MKSIPIRFELRISPVLRSLIDDWRRSEPDIPPRSEAVRRLVELGLAEKPRPDRARRPHRP